MRPRLYLAEATADRRAVLSPEKSHHLIRVLRKKTGDTVEVFDGNGNAYEAVIDKADIAAVGINILSAISTATDSTTTIPRIHIGQAAVRPAKMDWLVEKCTELGMASLTILPAEKSDTSHPPPPAAQQRWQRLTIAACEQCGRNTLPPISIASSWESWCRTLPPDSTRLHLSPHATTPPPPAGIATPSSPHPADTVDYYLAIGPESGFTQTEVGTLTTHHFIPTRIHSNTLRTETAAIAATAALTAPNIN